MAANPVGEAAVWCARGNDRKLKHRASKIPVYKDSEHWASGGCVYDCL